jgi:parvulin-like peptidyl-prolyl isomerase
MSNSSKALFALLLAVPAARAAMVEDTVATVNGSPILLSEYQKELQTALDYWTKTQPAALADPANLRKIRESTLEELITRELLIQEADRDKVKVRERQVDSAIDDIKARFRKDDHGADVDEKTADAAFQDQLKKEGLDYDRFRDRLLRQLKARQEIDEAVKAKVAKPTEAEEKEYFEKIKAYMATNSTDLPKGMDEDSGMALRQAAEQVKQMSAERVRVQRILIRLAPGASDNERRRAQKTTEDLRKRLEAGEDFSKVAHDESEDPESASRGGDIGYVMRGVAPPDLDKAVFALDVGQISQPIFTEIGYSLVRVTEKHAAETPDFDRFKDDLGNFLQQVAFRKKLESFVKDLRDKAVIERHLPQGA